MVGRQVVFAPCKINLHLGIHAQTDSRGYHRVDSVMMPVGLFDEVTVDDAPAFAVHHVPAIETSPENTTVWKAATLLAEELGAELNLRIDVKTRIPEKAGLGGSSADAGAALRALCERWGVDVHDPRVADVARRVGADVSFFLDPVPSLFLGAGDMLAETFPALPMPVVLVKPAGDGVSAAAAYGEYDRNPSEPPAFEAMCAALCATTLPRRQKRCSPLPRMRKNGSPHSPKRAWPWFPAPVAACLRCATPSRRLAPSPPGRQMSRIGGHLQL